MAVKPPVKRNAQDWVKPLYGLSFVFAVFAFVVLIRHVRFQGQDFDVFWKVARYLIEGAPVYDLVRDGAMSFKYPPWIVPFFVPFALMPLELAKWVWGFITAASMIVLFRHTRLIIGVSVRGVLWAAALFWGIWAVHQMDGQVVLPIVAGSLWAGAKFVDARQTPTARALFGALAMLALSTKVFTLIAFAGFFFSPLARGVRLGAIAAFACLALLLSIPALTVEKSGTVRGLVASWVEASSSGGALFDGEKVRGRDNQGVPALILRAASVEAGSARADLAVAVSVSVVGLLFWFFLFRNAPLALSVAVSFALAPVVHPLSWFHTFVFSFPLCAFALGQVFEPGQKPHLRWLLGLGVVMVALVTRKTLGGVGEALELYSIKSVGVILLIGASALSRKNNPTH